MKNNWAIRTLQVDGFTATAMVNKGYLEFENMCDFPYLLTVELSLLDTINDLPSPDENLRLEEIEENLVNIFGATQEVQYIGHVTREGWRDIFCYVASNDLDGEAIGNYCDTIEAERDIRIEINEDTEWDTAKSILG